ncbi:MAG: hypothetical protein M1431_03060 [Candidatus Thermoplasmatota archaeon]|nr:hypothetical protein [Candidatus Thermoplasmatota archaeon]
MPNTNFLQELNIETLKDIAQKEGLAKVPKNYEKEDIVKFLDGVLTAQKIKFYKKEYFERVIERETQTIREKISERGFMEQSSEITTTTFDRNAAITALLRSRINRMVVEQIANKIRDDIPTGSGINYWDRMSDRMLEILHDVFIVKKEDKTGRYFEFRCAEYLAGKDKNISRIGIDVKNSDTGNIEMDILGYRADESIRFMAECKDKKSVEYKDITAWLKRAEALYDKGLKLAYFFSSAGYTQGTIDRVKTMPNVLQEEDGAYVIDSGGMFKKPKYIVLTIFDVRNDKFIKVFP